MSLRSKIVVPFLLLFAREFVVVALLSASTAARSVESSIRRESEDLARVLGQAGFAPDRELLGKIKAIIGTDLARLDAAGGGLLSTLSQGDEAELLSRVGDALTEEERRGEGGSGSFDVALASGTRRAFYSPVESLRGSGKGSLLLLLLPVERIAGAKWDLVVPILLVAGAGALPVALVGVLLGMAITRPLRELSAAAARLAGGDLGDRVNVSGTDEIAALASSFNSMAEELERREAELLRSERLAVSGRLAAGVAHEIRNPLTAVRMSLQRAARAGEQGGALSADEAQVLLTEIERL